LELKTLAEILYPSTGEPNVSDGGVQVTEPVFKLLSKKARTFVGGAGGLPQKTVRKIEDGLLPNEFVAYIEKVYGMDDIRPLTQAKLLPAGTD
jgi:hypothetical protein